MIWKTCQYFTHVYLKHTIGANVNDAKTKLYIITQLNNKTFMNTECFVKHKNIVQNMIQCNMNL